jgi:hypothetical protein
MVQNSVRVSRVILRFPSLLLVYLMQPYSHAVMERYGVCRRTFRIGILLVVDQGHCRMGESNECLSEVDPLLVVYQSQFRVKLAVR